MKTILFVTSNRGKARSAAMILKCYGYRVVQVADRIEEPEHTEDPKAIADAKIAAASKNYHQPLMCEDGGFFVNALDGRPGVHVHGYLEEKGITGLLRELEGKRDRRARFRGVLAYLEPGATRPVHFISNVRGRVLSRPRGHLKPHSWSDLHLVFAPDGSKKTLAEMTETEYEVVRFKQDSRFRRLGEYLTARTS